MINIVVSFASVSNDLCKSIRLAFVSGLNVLQNLVELRTLYSDRE